MEEKWYEMFKYMVNKNIGLRKRYRKLLNTLKLSFKIISKITLVMNFIKFLLKQITNYVLDFNKFITKIRMMLQTNRISILGIKLKLS